MLQSVLVPVGIFLDGLLAGLFIGSCMVEQAARTLNGPNWIAYKQAKEALFGPVMPVVFGVVLIVTVGIAAVDFPHGAFPLAAGSLVVALVITVVVHLPLNKVVEGWSATDLPAGWDRARGRWRAWNWVRCGFAVAAFGPTVLGIR